MSGKADNGNEKKQPNQTGSQSGSPRNQSPRKGDGKAIKQQGNAGSGSKDNVNRNTGRSSGGSDSGR